MKTVIVCLILVLATPTLVWGNGVGPVRSYTIRESGNAKVAYLVAAVAVCLALGWGFLTNGRAKKYAGVVFAMSVVGLIGLHPPGSSRESLPQDTRMIVDDMEAQHQHQPTWGTTYYSIAGPNTVRVHYDRFPEMVVFVGTLLSAVIVFGGYEIVLRRTSRQREISPTN